MTKEIYVRGLNQSEAGTTGTTIRRGIRANTGAAAELTTALTGSNNDLTFTAKAAGTAGNSIDVTYTDPGGTTATLRVLTNGNHIVVNLGRAASAINTTATALKAAVDANSAAAATGLLTSDNTEVVDGDTVTIGSTVYRFKDTMAQAFDVKRNGTTADTTLDNLVKAINASGTPGSEYFAGTTIHPTVTASARAGHTVPLTAKTAGYAGNSIATTEASIHLSFGNTTLVNGSDAGNALVSVANAQGNTGAGLVTALSTTPLADGTASGTTIINNLASVQVDVDDPKIRKILARRVNEWIETLTNTNLVYIRSLGASSVTNANSIVDRGFRIKNSAGNMAAVIPGGAAVRVDLNDPLVRKALKQHYSRWIVGNNGDAFVTISGLQVSGASGYTLTRGFRIKEKNTGLPTVVTPGVDVQVNINDAYVRRILRRNVGRYVVVSSP